LGCQHVGVDEQFLFLLTPVNNFKVYFAYFDTLNYI